MGLAKSRAHRAAEHTHLRINTWGSGRKGPGVGRGRSWADSLNEAIGQPHREPKAGITPRASPIGEKDAPCPGKMGHPWVN